MTAAESITLDVFELREVLDSTPVELLAELEFVRGLRQPLGRRIQHVRPAWEEAQICQALAKLAQREANLWAGLLARYGRGRVALVPLLVHAARAYRAGAETNARYWRACARDRRRRMAGAR